MRSAIIITLIQYIQDFLVRFTANLMIITAVLRRIIIIKKKKLKNFSIEINCVFCPHCSHHMPVRLKASPKVQRTRLQYASWLGNTTSLAIVIDNDIYVRQSPANEEDIRITNTGKPDLIYNGVPDWLYQGNV